MPFDFCVAESNMGCRPANTKKFLSGSFPGQSCCGHGKAFGPKAEAGLEFLGKVNDFSLFLPLKKASPEQKVSTLNAYLQNQLLVGKGSCRFCTQMLV